MWLRTALLLVLGLILYRFLGRLLESLGRPARSAEPERPARPAGPSPGNSDGRGAAPGATPWPPDEVIDVPFREVPRDGTAAR